MTTEDWGHSQPCGGRVARVWDGGSRGFESCPHCGEQKGSEVGGGRGEQFLRKAAGLGGDGEAGEE